ncbi:hypothetical protein DL768_004651 [Monosporascus sp. mg162]|nr:hypothetical protein DL768_004651 [Monosporascus sp. mg162]
MPLDHATHSLAEAIEPLTVVEILATGDELSGERRVTFEELQGLFEKWRLTDDVWENCFLKKDARYKLQTEHYTSNIFCGPASRIRDCGVRDGVHPSGKVEGHKDFHGGTSITPSPGPYFVSLMDGRLMPAYRMYEDTYETFIKSTYSPSNGKNLPFPIHTGKLDHLSVAVPSRLQSQPTTPERPLAGLRFSRQQDQEARNNEPEGVVEVLQKMGAVFVGNNKLSEFAFAGPYHWQNTDYLLNFNPRADGLQTPSDSSGGSASAVAAYDWLDFAIGTDTGGSIRLPADANGVYGGRPTTGAIDASSMQSLAKSLDTVVNNNAKAAWKTIEAGEISESMYKEALAKKHMLKSWVNTYLTEEYSPISTLLVSRGSSQGEELRDTQSDERYFAPSQPGRILPYTHLNTLADLPGVFSHSYLHPTSSIPSHIQTIASPIAPLEKKINNPTYDVQITAFQSANSKAGPV